MIPMRAASIPSRPAFDRIQPSASRASSSGAGPAMIRLPVRKPVIDIDHDKAPRGQSAATAGSTRPCRPRSTPPPWISSRPGAGPSAMRGWHTSRGLLRQRSIRHGRRRRFCRPHPAHHQASGHHGSTREPTAIDPLTTRQPHLHHATHALWRRVSPCVKATRLTPPLELPGWPAPAPPGGPSISCTSNSHPANTTLSPSRGTRRSNASNSPPVVW